jgi:DNA-binding winged helix-turn-helix (wHTH) protein
MKSLWPDTFVDESNLSQHIYQLRKILGPSAQDPQYIVTVPGSGYRFAQKVEEVSAENGSGLVADGDSRQPVNVSQKEPLREVNFVRKVAFNPIDRARFASMKLTFVPVSKRNRYGP